MTKTQFTVNVTVNEEQVVRLVRTYQETLDDQQRLDLWSVIRQGYCPHCGRKLSPDYHRCNCWNDE